MRVALFRGRGLAIKDKNLLSKGGTSDPRVRFELLGGQFSDDKNERKKQEKERHFKTFSHLRSCQEFQDMPQKLLVQIEN